MQKIPHKLISKTILSCMGLHNLKAFWKEWMMKTGFSWTAYAHPDLEMKWEDCRKTSRIWTGMLWQIISTSLWNTWPGNEQEKADMESFFFLSFWGKLQQKKRENAASTRRYTCPGKLRQERTITVEPRSQNLKTYYILLLVWSWNTLI